VDKQDLGIEYWWGSPEEKKEANRIIDEIGLE